MKVALVAHEYSPLQGSECGEGWNVAEALANAHPALDLTVFAATGPQFDPSKYEADLRTHLDRQARTIAYKVKFVPYPWWTKPFIAINKLMFGWLSGIGLPLLYSWCYRGWLQSCKRAVCDVGRNAPFDVVHLLTQITIREPGEFWRIKESAFVWGPTGGVEVLPSSFARQRGLRFQVLNFLRDTYFKYRANRKNQLAAIKGASSVFAFTQADYDFLRKVRGGPKGVQLQVDAACMVPSDESEVRTLGTGETLRVIWAGQLNERKNLEVLINALSSSDTLRNNVSVTVVGDGPQKSTIEKRCRALQIENVSFVGAVQHEKVKKFMHDAHLLIHTSYREAGTHIIPEALSCGLPVICHNVSGMGVLIGDDNGWKIPLVSNATSEAALSEILLSILKKVDVVAERSIGALNYSKENTWKSMAEKFVSAYSSAMDEQR